MRVMQESTHSKVGLLILVNTANAVSHILGMVTMLQNPKNLPHVFGYDRVTIGLSQADIKGLDVALDPHCDHFTLTVQRMPYNSLKKAKLEIFQPSKSAFAALERCLDSSVRATPHYAELAWDIICNNPEQALSVGEWRHASIWFKSVRTRMEKPVKGATYYYAPRTKAGAKGKTPRVPVEYSDQPSKLRSEHAGQPCSHLEMRVRGMGALHQVGLYSLADLAQFDHLAYWRSAVEFYEVPGNKTALGRKLTGSRQISGTALRKKAKQWREKYTVAGHFNMHNACREKGKQFVSPMQRNSAFGKARRRCLI